MSVLDRFIAWCKEEQDSTLQQLELLESGKAGTYERSETTHTDTTAATIQQLRAKLSILDRLLLGADELP